MTSALNSRKEPAPGDAGQGPLTFTEGYYRQIIDRFGYDDFELTRFAFNFAGMRSDELNMRWLCHHRADQFLATERTRRVVTTGFGMSGLPHMGTVAQIIGITRMQQSGERTQVVLGDLDAHNGKGRPLGGAQELADRFAIFCRRLGYDDTVGGLRNQFDDAESLRNLYLLSHYADDADFERAEEDNHRYYASLGVVDDRMTFRRKTSLALMAADFLTLGQHADAVLVLLGIDEHKYVRFAAEIASRLSGNTSLRGTFVLASIYTRLASGFGGHPKMSKSIPGSSIDVTSSPDEIKRRINCDDVRAAEQSPTFQLINQLFLRPAEDCRQLRRECADASPAWMETKAELVDSLVAITELW
ncbi:hypothetical protein OHB12_22230 [Nocardia sp. NBC_01730]|uniref:hypothetical protein n=1 Tax=Nocardia sp. NBC_01730 TaxID=2975998 RepID=UPI002E1125FD|nr:hypothetical protein OHB12_22230 [Nocardia sp. NBC_01730]